MHGGATRLTPKTCIPYLGTGLRSLHDNKRAGHTGVLAPDACSLPIDERPRRAAEFGDLFATSLLAVERPSALTTHFRLAAGPRVAEDVADLVARETQCCSFFTFDLVPDEDSLLLKVSVPASQVAVLDGMTAMATAASQPRQ